MIKKSISKSQTRGGKYFKSVPHERDWTDWSLKSTTHAQI